jgi:hypothetical protein
LAPQTFLFRSVARATLETVCYKPATMKLPGSSLLALFCRKGFVRLLSKPLASV